MILRAWLARFRRDQPDRPLLEQMRELHDRPVTARILYAKPDGRERLNYCVRVLKSALRRAA